MARWPDVSTVGASGTIRDATGGYLGLSRACGRWPVASSRPRPAWRPLPRVRAFALPPIGAIPTPIAPPARTVLAAASPWQPARAHRAARADDARLPGRDPALERHDLC